MKGSRVERKKELSRISVKRRKTFVCWLVVLILLAVICYLNVLAFTILSVVLFFGILSINYQNIQAYMPGLQSSRSFVRFVAICIYVVIAFILIGRVTIHFIP